MDLLGSITIGGHKYSILLKDLVHEDDDKTLYGRHMVDANIIYLNKNIEESRKKETLIHEVIHAILYNTGQKHKEPMIEAISNGFFQLGIGDYIWEQVKKNWYK